MNDVSSPPERAKSEAAQLLAAMGAVRRVARRAVRTAAVADPLPPARSELLRLAARRPGIGVAEAAAELRLAPNSVSTMVSKLTEDGLLNRGRVASDGRSVRLTVTEAGAARIEQWQDIRTDLAGRALDRLTAADRQALVAAIPALTRLAEQMEELLTPPRGPADAVTQAVDCVDLSYQFATHLAVDHVNLSIAPGEMYGLLGPNGAGKTTTIRMITTLLTPGDRQRARLRHRRGRAPDARPAGHRLRAAGAVRRREPDRRRERGAVRPALRRAAPVERKQRVADALDAMGLTEAAGAAGRHLLGRHDPAA